MTQTAADTAEALAPFTGKEKKFSVVTLNKTGAVDYALLTYYNPDDIVIACDPAHPFYEAHSPGRYDMSNEDNIADADSIKIDGIMQDPGVVIVNGKPVCYDGSRRIRILRYLMEQTGQPIAVGVKIKRERADGKPMTDADALDYCYKAHAAANEHRVDDNPMSRARKSRLMLKGIKDDAGNVIRPPMSLEEVARLFRVQPKVIEEIQTLFNLCPQVQAALELPPKSPGYINQSAGLHIALVRNHEQQIAIYNRTTQNGTQAGDRDVSRKLSREAVKTGEVPAQAQTSAEIASDDRETHEIADYRPTRSALESARAALKRIAKDDRGLHDTVCAVFEHLLDPSSTALDGYDTQIARILRETIKPKRARK
jgi:hypothetical protein